MFGQAPENVAILRQFVLRQGGHHAPGVGFGDLQTGFIADLQYPAYPPVLRESRLVAIQYEVHAKPAGIEQAPGLKFVHPRQGGIRQYRYRRRGYRLCDVS